MVLLWPVLSCPVLSIDPAGAPLSAGPEVCREIGGRSMDLWSSSPTDLSGKKQILCYVETRTNWLEGLIGAVPRVSYSPTSLYTRNTTVTQTASERNTNSQGES